MFYGEDAAKVAKVLNSALFTRETALGEVQVTGFPPSLWARKSKELWSAGNDVYLAGLNEDGTHHQTKHLHKEDYLPIGSIINMDGRKFRIDGVDFDKGKVSLQDMALADLRMPIFREEPLSVVRELYEQQDEALDAAPEKAVDYKVGDDIVVDLLTRTIEGKIGYVGETDVRIDTSVQGYPNDKAKLIVREMAEILMFRLTEKKLVTESITLEVGYDRENVDKGGYRGLTQTDRYGRIIPKAAHGTVRFDAPTNLGSTIINESAKLFERITDPALTVRRITINANKVTPDEGIYQVDFFTDTKKLEKEKKLQQAMLGIKNKYGKNAVLKASSYEEGATMRQRNAQIGGHSAGGSDGKLQK